MEQRDKEQSANPPVSPFEKGGSRGISSFHAPSATDVIREARTWIHTPFLHQGILKGKGADCRGLIQEVARTLGISDVNITGYGRDPVPEEMGRIMDEHLDRVMPKSAKKPGDILWLRDPSDSSSKPRHLCIYTTDNTVIHISSQIQSGNERGRCVEHRLSDKWEKAIFRVYRYRGLSGPSLPSLNPPLSPFIKGGLKGDFAGEVRGEGPSEPEAR